MSSVVICLGYTGCVLGIIQGLTWMTLSLCAILIRFDAWIPDINEMTHLGALNNALLYLYVLGIPNGPNSEVIVTRDVVTVWLFFYLVVSAAWVFISMWQLYVLLHEKEKLYKTVFPIWTACTCVISLSDLILTILLGVDYDYIRGVVNKDKEGPLISYNFYIILASGIAMAIAARGFVLWLVNVVVAVALTFLQYRHKGEVSEILRQHISAYEASHVPYQAKDNFGFDWEHDKPQTSASSGDDLYGQTLPRLPPIPPIQSTNERLAKIGKTPGTTTPSNVPTPQPPQTFLFPRVPSPDYSPVFDRKNGQAKSALKTRTENVYTSKF